MGGSALQLVGIETRRIGKKEFSELVTEVTNAADGLLHWVKPVKFYHSKADMGDIDFVAYGKSDAQGSEIVEWGETLMSRLNSKGYHYNKPVLSFEYKGVQIDIATRYSEEKAKAYLEFCHYSPIGNVVGRMLKQTGAKWGVDGLVYPVRDKNEDTSHILGHVPLSMDITGPLNLAGLDVNKWKAGFEEENDIFAFCVESKLFNKEMFAFENLNHVNRKRDRLRRDYHSWLAYIQDKPDKYPRYTSSEEQLSAKEAWRAELCKMFPESNLEAERQKLFAEAEERRALHHKFNGNLVRELTGLEGKELGNFLSSFKAEFESPKAHEEWIRHATESEIKNRVLEAHNQPEISI